MKFIISASNAIGRPTVILQLRYALFKEEKPVGNNNVKCKELSLLVCFAVSLGKYLPIFRRHCDPFKRRKLPNDATQHQIILQPSATVLSERQTPVCENIKISAHSFLFNKTS